MEGNANDQPYPSFTHTSGFDQLKVVRVDKNIKGIEGDDIESECQALNANYHELTMDDQIQYEVKIN